MIIFTTLVKYGTESAFKSFKCIKFWNYLKLFYSVTAAINGNTVSAMSRWPRIWAAAWAGREAGAGAWLAGRRAGAAGARTAPWSGDPPGLDTQTNNVILSQKYVIWTVRLIVTFSSIGKWQNIVHVRLWQKDDTLLHINDILFHILTKWYKVMTGCRLTLQLPGDQLAGLLGSGGGAVGVAVEEEPSSGQQRSQQHQHGDRHTWCRS